MRKENQTLHSKVRTYLPINCDFFPSCAQKFIISVITIKEETYKHKTNFVKNLNIS